MIVIWSISVSKPINHGINGQCFRIHNPNFALNIARHRFKMVSCTIVLVLGLLSMEILSLPLDLEVSIKGAQNGSITSRSWTCMVEGQFCLFHATLCCKPLHCLQYYNNPLILTCQKEKNGTHLESKGKNIFTFNFRVFDLYTLKS